MKNLVTSLVVTVMLISIMMKTPSPKIIFVPFLLCSISMAGQSIALLIGKKVIANFFHKIYAAGFFLFWFGCIGLGSFICIRDKNFGMLLFLGIFLVVGILMMRRKLFNKRGTEESAIDMRIIVGSLLVVIVLLAGVVLVIWGIKRQVGGIIFMGAFFVLGASAFILGALALKGCFDKCKIDVLGLYFGIVFVIIGIGFFIMGYHSQNNIPKAVLVIPGLMAAAGVLQVVKCIKNRN